jgi:isochorismate hydrolase
MVGMTTLQDRPGTALLVIDVQNGVVAAAVKRGEVIANIAALVGKARATGVPVIWVQHSDEHLPLGSPEWKYVPELVQERGEPVVHKHYGDSFEDTDLEQVLAERGIGHLVGAPPPEQVIAHTNLYWTWEVGPGRTSATVDTAEVSFALAG